MSAHTADPTRESDIRTEFALGATVGGVSALGTAAVIIGLASSAAEGAGVAGGAGIAGAGFLTAVFSIAVLDEGGFVLPERERPRALCLGVALGLGIPVGLGLPAGDYVHNRLEEKAKIVASAPANYNRDVMGEFTKDMKSKGYDVTLACR